MKQINETTFTSDNGLITFIHGDCMEFMAGCKENEFDLAVVDPPYGINASEMTMGTGKNKKYSKGKKWDSQPPTKEYFNSLFNVSKNQIIFGGNYFELPLIKGWIIWDKLLNKDISFADGEMAWNSFNKNLKIIKHQYSGFLGADDNRIHNTQKPILLYQKIYKNYAKLTDHILDTHGGSMSSAIAAHMEGLRMTIIELDDEYFQKSLKRFANYERQQTINFE